MKIKFTDKFDIEKTAFCGQTFRVRRGEDGRFTFIHGEKTVTLGQVDDSTVEADCSEGEWEDIWSDYFDMGKDYDAVIGRIAPGDGFLTEAARYGRGIRILRQDPWEALICFIISQRKSMKAISTSVELLCERFGGNTDREGIPAFPTPRALSEASLDDLKACALGYRAPYIADAARSVYLGELSLVD
ncbi:MAG: DNA-3-methyladenine glycosylase 2 family protein, partial [Eubacterium sp.]|nr:DNA-3-methyladenine glycosylase 2 family protein [Eubacterium sp.]